MEYVVTIDVLHEAVNNVNNNIGPAIVGKVEASTNHLFEKQGTSTNHLFEKQGTTSTTCPSSGCETLST
ncbi:hypothetical protein ZEAMMB73_Zm00001d051184 [Zea mays]|uniref:Uncharacterized protein n=1 Tax=Zea mays TaxID=4577 RepID=A0A1D6Q5H5_MAIZE|nr:hypothetical protein ZEAMMB73_Zm00001d051184 [Zea mays]